MRTAQDPHAEEVWKMDLPPLPGGEGVARIGDGQARPVAPFPRGPGPGGAPQGEEAEAARRRGLEAGDVGTMVLVYPKGVHGGVRGPRGEHPGPPGPRRGGGGAFQGPRPPSGQDRLRGLFFRSGKLPVSGWSPGSRDIGGELAFLPQRDREGL